MCRTAGWRCTTCKYNKRIYKVSVSDVEEMYEFPLKVNVVITNILTLNLFFQCSNTTITIKEYTVDFLKANRELLAKIIDQGYFDTDGGSRNFNEENLD